MCVCSCDYTSWRRKKLPVHSLFLLSAFLRASLSATRLVKTSPLLFKLSATYPPSPPQYQELPWTHRKNAFEIESVATVSVTLRRFITQTDMMRRHLCDVLSHAPIPLMWSSEVRTLVLSAELNRWDKPAGRAPGLLLRQQRIQSSRKWCILGDVQVVAES